MHTSADLSLKLLSDNLSFVCSMFKPCKGQSAAETYRFKFTFCGCD